MAKQALEQGEGILRLAPNWAPWGLHVDATKKR